LQQSQLEKPNTLFRSAYVGAYLPDEGTPWDISPDGKRFLMIKPPQPAGDASAAKTPRKITIVVNWFEELQKRVPVP
jgi:hypothetical protein